MSLQTRQHDPAPPTGEIEPTLDQGMQELSAAPAPSIQYTTGPEPPPYNPGLPRTFGRYQLLQVLGQGGMGVVYKAKQTGLDRLVALKMILAGAGASEHAIARFRREAQSASSLDHPNIVPIHDFGDLEGQHYYTMAFVEGQTLSDKVAQEGPPPAAETIRLMLALTGAMGYAHQKGLIHRDLKPDNILIDSQGQPRVLDFGLARLIEGDRLTCTGQILGTPSYMSPEQARGESTIGPPSDLYALGAVLYFLLTGHRPFEGDSPLQTLIRVTNEIPIPPRQLNFTVTTALDAICMRCLEKNPEDRFPSAEALSAALKQAAVDPNRSDTPALSASKHANSLPPHTPTRATPRARHAVLLGVGVGAVVLGAAAAVFFATRQSDGTTPSELAQGPTPTQPVAGDDPLLPKNLTTEFGLTVEVIGGKTQKDGPILLIPGEEIKLKITVERDAYIGIWTHGENGSVHQLFPNEDEPEHLVKAGQPRIIPGTEEAAFQPQAARRPEHLRIIASTTKWDAMQGEKDGPYLVFKTAEQRRALADTQRDILYVRKKSPQQKSPVLVSEAVIPYWVR